MKGILIVFIVALMYTSISDVLQKKKMEDSNKVIVYSKSYCPYCVKAKSLLSSLDIDYETIEVVDDETSKQFAKATNGARTVPQIIINGKLVGGFDDLNALHKEGNLLKLLGRNQ